MGKRSAVVELFLGDMGSMQRELRPSTQREDQLTMETKLETDSSESCEPTAEERGAGNPHATFCGSRGRVTASGDPVLGVKFPGPTRHSRHFDRAPITSGLPRLADIFRDRLHVSKVPKGDMRRLYSISLSTRTAEPARLVPGIRAK